MSTEIHTILESLKGHENSLMQKVVSATAKAIQDSPDDSELHSSAFMSFVRAVDPDNFPADSLEKDADDWQGHVKGLLAREGYQVFGSLEKHYLKDHRGVYHPHAVHQKDHGRGAGKRTLAELATAFKEKHPDVEMPTWDEMMNMGHHSLVNLAAKHGFLPQTRGDTLNVVDNAGESDTGKFQRRAYDADKLADSPERGAGKNLNHKNRKAALDHIMDQNEKLQGGKKWKAGENRLGTISRHDEETHDAPRKGHKHRVANPEQSGAEAAGSQKGKRGYGAYDPKGDLKDQKELDEKGYEKQRMSQKFKARVRREVVGPKPHIDQLVPKPTKKPVHASHMSSEAKEVLWSKAKVRPETLTGNDIKTIQDLTQSNDQGTALDAIDALGNYNDWKKTNAAPAPKPEKGNVAVAEKPKVEQAPEAEAAKPTSGVIPSFDDQKLTLGASAGGSNDSKWATDSEGNKWLVKPNKGNEDRVANELVANAIYQELGASVPKAGTYTVDGKKAVAYKSLPGQTVGSFTEEQKAALGEHFMADALLANHDFVGLTKDNILWNGSEPTRIDQGGALLFRAMGEKKDLLEVHPAEIKTMFQKGQAKGNVKVSEAQLKTQAKEIAAKLTPEKIDSIVDAAPWKSEKDKQQVKNALKQRVKWMDGYAKGEKSVPDVQEYLEPSTETPAEVVETPEAEAPEKKPKSPTSPEAKKALKSKREAFKKINTLLNSSDTTSNSVGKTLLGIINNPDSFDPAKMKESSNPERAAAQKAVQQFAAEWMSAGEPELPELAPKAPLTPEQKSQRALDRLKGTIDRANQSKFIESIKDKSVDEKKATLAQMGKERASINAELAELKSKGKPVPKELERAKQQNMVRSKLLQAHLVDAHAVDLKTSGNLIRNEQSKAARQIKQAALEAREQVRRKFAEKLSLTKLQTRYEFAYANFLGAQTDVENWAGVHLGEPAPPELVAHAATIAADLRAMKAVLRDKHKMTGPEISGLSRKGKKRYNEVYTTKEPILSPLSQEQARTKVLKPAQVESPENKKHISRWQSDSSPYRNPLRQLKVGKEVSPAQIEQAMEMQKVILSQKPTTEPVVIVRSSSNAAGVLPFSYKTVQELTDNLQPGKIVREQDFTNGGLADPENLNTSFSGGHSPLHIVISFPEGAHLVHATTHTGRYSNEKEVIAPSGMTYRVTKVDAEGWKGKAVVYMEALSNDQYDYLKKKLEIARQQATPGAKEPDPIQDHRSAFERKQREAAKAKEIADAAFKARQAKLATQNKAPKVSLTDRTKIGILHDTGKTPIEIVQSLQIPLASVKAVLAEDKKIKV